MGKLVKFGEYRKPFANFYQLIFLHTISFSYSYMQLIHLLILGYDDANIAIKMPTKYQWLLSQHQLTNSTTVTHPPNGLN